MNLAIGWRVNGPVRPDVAQRALDEIVRRHEILRTRLLVLHGQVVQAIASDVNMPLNLVDLGRFRPSRRGHELALLAASELQRPFRLTEAPLLRARLVRIGHDEQVLLLIACHAIWDGASTTVFGLEFGSLYQAFASGGTSPLPELAIQMGDLAEWERHRMQSCASDVRTGPTACARFADAERTPSRTPHLFGATCSPSVGPMVLRSLERLGQGNGSTLTVVMLAAMATLVHARTPEDPVRVALAIANRDAPETRALIGLVAEAVPLDVPLADEPTLAELVRRVHEGLVGVYASSASMASLVPQRLGWPKNMRALAPVSLNVVPPELIDNAPLRFGPLVMRRYEPPEWWAAFPVDTVWQYGCLDVTVLSPQRGDRAYARVAFNANAIEPARAAAFARDFIRLLRLAARDPQRSVRDLIQRLAELEPWPPAEACASTTPDSGLLQPGRRLPRRWGTCEHGSV